MKFTFFTALVTATVTTTSENAKRLKSVPQLPTPKLADGRRRTVSTNAPII
ncbi:hypothetical protein FD04_GL001938 [Secundilactobacillus odoratitofui DSM 19909 = JCM 15043]|uniref:Uncharacterized protein n=1 Tax=Secundilactobacillus odoratitofui DSM 19909 = JCM 15043 TaxID=1423776 RepID=A0A0R1LME4_9LACO|nr:hypothetical protein [Secundilactobacillus odoratitofui]KRK97078.1 hypothetical protein FD04_GL001938 [Secundilactobacillus odoratitofui DSM 19909 = JCM 15043]